MTHLAHTVLNALINSNDPRFTEDIAHLKAQIAVADANDLAICLTKPSTVDSIAHLSKGVE